MWKFPGSELGPEGLYLLKPSVVSHNPSRLMHKDVPSTIPFALAAFVVQHVNIKRFIV
jgi:hypothetical protein